MARLHPTKCPTCGAGIRVDPAAPNVVCRYCQTTLTIEKRTPPPNVPNRHHHHGMGQVMGPSTTLYLDPKAVRRTSAAIGIVIAFATLLPVLIPIGIFLAGPALKAVKGNVRPFPATCGVNEKLELSGDYSGPGPAITSVGINCKITISKAKIKAASLVSESATNFELTLVDSTIETTGPLLKGSVNTKLRVKGGSLKSGGPVVTTSGYNLDVRLDHTTIESTADVAIVGPSLILDANVATLRGKKGVLEIENNAKVHSEGSSFEAAGPTFVFESNADLDLAGGSVVSKTSRAIEAESNLELKVSGTKIEGATEALRAKSNPKIKASDKASFVGTSGTALVFEANAEVTLEGATVEGGRLGIESDSNTVLKLLAGSQVRGKRGGIQAGSLSLEFVGAKLEGGSGPALATNRPERIEIRQGSITGTPAISFKGRPRSFELEGTRVVGAQVVPGR